MAEAVPADVENDEVVEVLEAPGGHGRKVVAVQVQFPEEHLVLEQPPGQRREPVAAQLDLLKLGVGGNEGVAEALHAAVLQLELPELLHGVEVREAAAVVGTAAAPTVGEVGEVVAGEQQRPEVRQDAQLVDGVGDGQLVVAQVEVLQGLEVDEGGGLDRPDARVVEEEGVEGEAAPEGAVPQHLELVPAQVEALEVVEAREGLAVDRGYPVVAEVDLGGARDSEEPSEVSVNCTIRFM